MAEKTVYPFADDVKTACVIFAVLLTICIISIPLAIWFLIRRNSAQLSIDSCGFSVIGLGLSEQRFDYSDLSRIGLLHVSVPRIGIAGVIAQKLSGGSQAVNLCAITKSGAQTEAFMLSRFRDHEQILTRIVTESGLPMETLSQGLAGPKWP